jgi:C4-dicarboxylate transporter, DctQ subunit
LLSPASRAYNAILYGMAWLAGILMVAMMAMIVADVALRNLGYQSSAHFFTFTEYFLLFIPLLGAPWLVREKGHIYIEVLIAALPQQPGRLLTRAIVVVCIAVSLVLAWFGAAITVQDFVGNEKDVRSLDMPRWMVVGFGSIGPEIAKRIGMA